MGTPSIDNAKLHKLGIPDDFDVNRSMAEFYVLERLTADGSRKAAKLLFDLEQKHAPILLNYLSAICGGELRHGPRIWGESMGCDGWNCNGEESEYCSCCGNDADSHDTYLCADCGLTEDDSCAEHEICAEHDDEYDCNCHEYRDGDDLAGCGCYCPEELCYQCQAGQEGDGDWDHGLQPALVDWFREGSWDSGRSGAWVSWQQDMFYEHGAPALQWAADAFKDKEWDGGSYGGTNWGTIAQIAHDYAAGKLSPRLFMDRCWTLEHNGGNVFDKMFDHHTTTSIGKALQRQAKDDYGFLQTWCSTATRQLWQVRDYRRFQMFDRDPAWLGVQRTFDPEVDW